MSIVARNSSLARIPSLDGVRAVAVALVCIGHFSQVLDGGHAGRITRFTEIQELGVTIFFVLSGFLITTLLLREAQTRGRISLSRFYFRRTLRIFPAAYCFIVMAILLHTVAPSTFRFASAFPALTYTSDFFRPGGWVLEHTWSLSVEEQFYLLWPCTLLLLSRRAAFGVAAALVLICPALRVALLALFPHHGGAITYQFEFVADALATGCLLAGFRDRLWVWSRYRQFLHSRWFVLVPICVLIAAEEPGREHRMFLAFTFLVGYSVANLGIALCLDWCIHFSTGRLGALLNTRPVAWVGLISYSIYLWQEIFLSASSPLILGMPELNILPVLPLAAASYVLVERPALLLRARLEDRLFAPRRSSQLSTIPPSEVSATLGAAYD